MSDVDDATLDIIVHSLAKADYPLMREIIRRVMHDRSEFRDDGFLRVAEGIDRSRRAAWSKFYAERERADKAEETVDTLLTRLEEQEGLLDSYRSAIRELLDGIEPRQEQE